ncbi:MAG: phosphate ABC transporter permease PstA, partial [Cyanobium sp.]
MAHASLTRSLSNPQQHGDLFFNPALGRNRLSKLFNLISGSFAAIAVLPLFLVLAYVLIKGGSLIRPGLFTQLPPAPGSEGGGIGNAILGTLLVTLLASLIAIPVGVGGGVFLAEYSKKGWFSRFVRFGNDVLAGVPSIISGVFVYGAIVATRLFFGQSYSAMAGAIALSVLMLPTIIKTTDEGLRLVPNDLRLGSYGVGASRFVTISQVTLPAAFTPIAT